MTVPNASCKAALTCKTHTPLVEAARKMTDEQVGALCVLDDDMNIVGLLSERDAICQMLDEAPAATDTIVGDAMKGPHTVHEGMEIDDVLRLMAEIGVRHIPLVDAEGKPRAMLTMRRMLDYRLEQLRDENEALACFLMADGIGG